MEHSTNINLRATVEVEQRNDGVTQGRLLPVDAPQIEAQQEARADTSLQPRESEEEVDLRTLVSRGSELARRMDDPPEPEECPEDRDKWQWSPPRSTVGGSSTESIGSQLRQRQEAENENAEQDVAAAVNRREPPPLPKKMATRELRRKLEMKRPKVLVSLGPLMPTEAQRNERKDSAMDSDSDF